MYPTNLIRFFLILAVFGVSGCAVFEQFQDEIAASVADIIDEYCAETDADARREFLAELQKNTDHAITINCAN